MDKKISYFYMRLSFNQKELLRDLAKKKNMTMAQYVWHLVTKDMEDKNAN